MVGAYFFICKAFVAALMAFMAAALAGGLFEYIYLILLFNCDLN